MEYCCILSLLTTGNTFPDGFNSIIQLSESFFKVESTFNKIQQKTFYIKEDEDILLNTFTYVDKASILNANKFDSNIAIEYIYKILYKVYQSNLYLIGWDISNSLSIINMNYERLIGKKIEFINELKVIDVKKLFSLTCDLNKVGTYSLQTALLWLYDNNYDEYLNHKNKQFYNYCEETNDIILLLLKKLINNDTLGETYEYLNKPHVLKTMPFGKYKNYSFESIMQNDMNYLHWLIKQSNLAETDKDLAFTLQTLLSGN